MDCGVVAEWPIVPNLKLGEVLMYSRGFESHRSRYYHRSRGFVRRQSCGLMEKIAKLSPPQIASSIRDSVTEKRN